ncbi:MAG: flagellar biosynthesis anti-sigma factor FlgM [Nitrospinota bacterium]
MGKTDKSANIPQNSSVRMELVKKYRKEINEKKYRVKSLEIASKMAKELFTGKIYPLI